MATPSNHIGGAFKASAPFKLEIETSAFVTETKTRSGTFETASHKNESWDTSRGREKSWSSIIAQQRFSLGL